MTTGPAKTSPAKAKRAVASSPATTLLRPEVAASTTAFSRNLAAWYSEHARELPWRGIHDPYATWLSEIMLQQTRVATVIDRYKGFLVRFPTLKSLARANENDVLALWSGLGYYRRARMLHRGAQFVERELDGVFPDTAEQLRTLPGIGDYTAAAIASIAFGESIAVVDGNVERVVLRLLGLPQERGSAARLHVCRTAQALLPVVKKSSKSRPAGDPPANSPANHAGDHNQAMMELGATICLPKAPLCLQCPVFDFCRTRGEHPTPPRAKQQSRVVAHLLAVRKAGTETQVLLERRSRKSSLMPGMMELPPLPLSAVEDLEPVLRIRHAITNTNYYAQIFSEGVTSDKPATIRSLVDDIPAAYADLKWTPTSVLLELPLTGLARKVLQRLGVMEVPKLRMD